MKSEKKIPLPSFQQFKAACDKYQRTEEPTYRVATLYIDQFWGKPKDIADGICVLLLVWNKAFYSRFGSPSVSQMADRLAENMETLNKLRSRAILSYDEVRDARSIAEMFRQLLGPLSARGKFTPVGVAKALHLLATGFLPLWDNRIARAYGCAWRNADDAVGKYLEFLRKIKAVCQHLVDHFAVRGGAGSEAAARKIIEVWSKRDRKHTLVKLVDEYNYIKFVKPYLRR